MGGALLQLDILSAEVGSTTSENLKSIILGLGTYFFPVDALSKQKRAMLQGMKNPCGLKVRFYAAHMIDCNKCLALVNWEKASDNTCESELNEILLNRIPNSWIRQAYFQGFDCESITLKSVKMFECMEVAEYIY